MGSLFERTRTSVTLFGALLIFLGAAILANPGDVTAFIVRLMGFACALFGLMTFVTELLQAQSKDAIPFGTLALSGVLMMAGTGVVLFADSVAKILFILIGLLIVASGLRDIEYARTVGANDEDEHKASLRVGIITLAAGIFVMVVPAAAVRVVPIVSGVFLVLDGLSQLFLALQMEE